MKKTRLPILGLALGALACAATAQRLNSVNFPTSDIGYVGGSNGILLKTTDGGVTWIAKPSGTARSLTKLYFPSSDRGFAVADSLILRTTNGGDSWDSTLSGTWWTDTHTRAPNILDLHFPTLDTGYAATTSQVLRTTNGGVSWARTNGGAIGASTCLFFTSGSVGFSGGENILWKTVDAGITWTAIPTGHGGDVYYEDIYFNGKDTGYVGLGVPTGGMAKTTDGGNTWTDLNSGIAALYDVPYLRFPDSSTGYAIVRQSPGITNIFIKTVNGGTTWSTDSLGASFRDFTFTNAGTGFGVAADGIWKTTDGGAHWSHAYTVGIALKSPRPGFGFQGSGVYTYQLTAFSKVKVVLRDVQGRALKQLVNQSMQPGEYKLDLGEKAASGIYVLDFQVNGSSKLFTIVLDNLWD